MDHEHALKEIPDSAEKLLASLTLKALKSIEACGMDQVLKAIADLKHVVLEAHAAEMRNVDKETNDIARALDRLSKKLGSGDPDLIAELSTIARKLDSTGKQIKILGSTVDPLTP